MKLNISKIVTLISALPTLSNAVEQLVQQFEKSGYTGEQKKATVLNVLKLSLETSETLIGIDIPTDVIIAIAGKLIDLIVEVKNDAGEFTHQTSGGVSATTATAQS